MLCLLGYGDAVEIYWQCSYSLMLKKVSSLWSTSTITWVIIKTKYTQNSTNEIKKNKFINL